MLAIWGFAILATLLGANQPDRGAHRTIKILHGCFVAYLILWHRPSARAFGWALGHSGEIVGLVYVERGVFPPVAAASIWTLGVIFGLFAIALGFGLARRKERARKLFLWAVPVLSVIDWLGLLFDLMETPTPDALYVAMAAILSLVVVLPYVPMALFYSRRRVIEAVFIPRDARE